MKNIIFIAPPAAGKGTQSDLLVKKYGYNHISTGDLLREEVRKQSEIGVEIDNLMKSGQLVSDDIVSNLLKTALESSQGPFILDGYPRDVKQISILNNILNDINKSVDLVIQLDVNYDILVRRVTGRLSCPKCSRSYHRDNLKPKVEWVCDDCGSSLISRTDDNEETFKNRYKTYLDNMEPILDYYNNLDMVKVIEDKRSDVNEVFEEIEKVIL